MMFRSKKSSISTYTTLSPQKALVTAFEHPALRYKQ